MNDIEWASEKMAQQCLDNGYDGKLYYNPLRIQKDDAVEFLERKGVW